MINCNYCIKDKLCYYHQKIEDGLIDEPEDTPEIVEEHTQIWEYIPLVRSRASLYSRIFNMDYLDLCQQGYLILADITVKVDWQMSKPSITAFVKLKLGGLMKKYVAKMGKTVSAPDLETYFKIQVESIDSLKKHAGTDEYNHDDEVYVTEILIDSSPNPEDQLLIEERKDMLRGAVAVILPTLNEREFYVLFNCMLTDAPLTYREVGDQFNVSYESIRRDVTRLKARLYEYIKA